MHTVAELRQEYEATVKAVMRNSRMSAEAMAEAVQKARLLKVLVEQRSGVRLDSDAATYTAPGEYPRRTLFDDEQDDDERDD